MISIDNVEHYLFKGRSRCAVGRPHTLRRPFRDTMARVIGTIGRGGAAAVRCQEYDELCHAFRTPTVRPFTHSCDPIHVLTTGSVRAAICLELPSPSLRLNRQNLQGSRCSAIASIDRYRMQFNVIPRTRY